jgi:hypothetical protein
MYDQLQRLFTPDWLTAIGTVGACAIALFLALFAKRIERWMDHPALSLNATVRRPDAEKTSRWFSLVSGATLDAGEAWFFRLTITNNGTAPAREVQVFLKTVERVSDGTVSLVDRFSPMNLKWTHTGKPTRDVLLTEIPVFCDFIHVSDPKHRHVTGEVLSSVPPEAGVLCLDVEVATSGRGHLLEPGIHRFHLILAAENFDPETYTVEVQYSGLWSEDQDQMFAAIKMKKL